MPQSLTIQMMHLVFSTHERRPWLDTSLQPRLFAFQAGILSSTGSTPYIVNGMADHVHMLFSLAKGRALTDVVREVKASSSRWMKQQGPQYGAFAWQRRYVAFSVSPSNREQVERYIQGQQQHHARISFQDELRALLERHKLEYDERYLWD